MAEMIRSGTTCFNDMFYFPEAIAEAANIAGVRGFVSIHVIDFPTPWTQTTDESLEKGKIFYEQYHGHPLITPTIAPHAPYTVCDESLMKVKAMANELQLKINMHVHETQAEIEHSLTNYKKRPIQRLRELGLLSPDLIAIHSVQLNEEDLDTLRDTNPNIVHCPVSNMKLASGICPVEMLRERGLNVALGTDSVASNNNLDMINEMRIAALLSKVSTLNPESLNVDDTIELATLNGARALGMERKIGSLQPGKAADMIAIDLDGIETLPMFDPLVQLVYASSRHQVTDVWVAGKQLMKDRQLLTLDEMALKEKARLWRV
jgi:5-methylthioadenosine/S-adenosylhomocysteine deaminase